MDRRTRREARRRVRHWRRSVILLLTATTAVVGRSAAGATLVAMQGTVVCRHLPNATAREYLVGLACPPSGFLSAMGYRPMLREAPYGWRYTRPPSAGGGCSGPLPDVGPFWDFTIACQAHDYGYDLVRFGVASRRDADALLYHDMMSSCGLRAPIPGGMCRTVADSAHAVLELGDVAPGFEPPPISPA